MKEDKHLLLGTAAAALLFGSTAVLGSAQASPLEYVGICPPASGHIPAAAALGAESR
jgi:hypothetical protein